MIPNQDYARCTNKQIFLASRLATLYFFTTILKYVLIKITASETRESLEPEKTRAKSLKLKFLKIISY